jgi:hypothetical protein
MLDAEELLVAEQLEPGVRDETRGIGTASGVLGVEEYDQEVSSSTDGTWS